MTTAMTADTPMLPVKNQKIANSGTTDTTSVRPIHGIGASMSVRSIWVAPPERIRRYASMPDRIPLTRLTRILTSAHNPPTTMAPTPRNRVCVLQSVPATSTAGPSGAAPVATRIGMAIHQLSTPPMKISTAMFSPTM